MSRGFAESQGLQGRSRKPHSTLGSWGGAEIPAVVSQVE